MACIGLLMTMHSYGQMVNTGELTIASGTEVGVIENFENKLSGVFLNDGTLYWYGHITNRGRIGYTAEGTIFLAGNAQQIFDGNEHMKFYDLVFSNRSSAEPFLCSGLLHVDHSIDFLSGIVNVRSQGGLVQFGLGATHYNASSESHINGSSSKLGNEMFLFPIGDQGFFRPSHMSAPSAVDDGVVSTYFLSNSDTEITPHTRVEQRILSIDNTEYWEIEKISGNPMVWITLEWDVATSPSFITLADPETVHIVQWSTTQNSWIDLGGVVNSATHTVTTMAPIEEGGIFTLAIVEKASENHEVKIYNALTPNNDGKNDFLRIEGIDQYPENTVIIFNRQGIEVFRARGYNESSNVFMGISNTGLGVGSSKTLPTGTYFYILEYRVPGSGGSSSLIKKSGFLYITTGD